MAKVGGVWGSFLEGGGPRAEPDPLPFYFFNSSLPPGAEEGAQLLDQPIQRSQGQRVNPFSLNKTVFFWGVLSSPARTRLFVKASFNYPGGGLGGSVVLRNGDQSFGRGAADVDILRYKMQCFSFQNVIFSPQILHPHTMGRVSKCCVPFAVLTGTFRVPFLPSKLCPPPLRFPLTWGRSRWVFTASTLRKMDSTSHPDCPIEELEGTKGTRLQLGPSLLMAGGAMHTG